MSDPVIDWTGHDPHPPDHLVCACGASWESHTAMRTIDGRMTLVARTPCPQCQSDRTIRQAFTDGDVPSFQKAAIPR